MNDIIKKLMEFDEAYHNGDSLIPDVQYDQLKLQAQKDYPNDPYFIKVGSDVRSGKVLLPYTMGSLNQIYDGYIGKWVDKYSLSKQVVDISDKLDGISAMLQYKDGKFSIAYSRGNGVEGADITRHVKNINHVPTDIGNGYLTVRGEIIMQDSVFESNYSDEFANPRGMVAGSMNRKVTPISYLKNIDFVAYQIVDGSEDFKTSSQNEDMLLLEKLGFKVVKRRSVYGNQLNDKFLKETLKKCRDESEYTLDGIVLTISQKDKQKTFSNSGSLNPEYSIKYKVLDEDSIVTARVVDIHYEVSKHGFFKPRIEINPVRLFGTVVTYATGFNGKFIEDNNLGPGAEVKITKSGTVIPYILEVVTSAPKIKYPNEYWKFNESGVEFIVGNLDTHPEMIFKQILDFFETLDVDHLKEANLRKVFEYCDFDGMNYEGILEHILSLWEPEWVRIVGANGEKIYNSLQRRLENLTMEKYLGAVKYLGFGFGTRKAKMLLKNLKKDDDVWNLTIEDIVSYEGFDVKTASMIYQGLDAALDLLNLLDLDLIEEEKSSDLDHLNVVFTGFRDKEFQGKLEKMGAKVSTSVSKKTTHLVTAEPNSTSSKAKKARDLEVDVLSLSEFKDLLNL